MRVPYVEGFEIGEPLGHGGEGDVYRARQTAVGRFVAIKFQRQNTVASDGVLEGSSLGIDLQFDNEMSFAGRIHHESVVPIYHGMQAEHSPCSRDFMVTKLIVDEQGRASTAWDFVAKRIESEKDLVELEEFYRCAATQFLAIAKGLRAVHEEGVIHRDVKLRNILVGESSRFFLSDFGLAMNIEIVDQPICGSHYYIAPEQLAGRPSTQSDVFSFGLAFAIYLGATHPVTWGKASKKMQGLSDKSDARLNDSTTLAGMAEQFTEATRSEYGLAKDDLRKESGLRSLPPESDFRASDFCPHAPRFLRYIVDTATKRETSSRTNSAADFEQQLVDYLDGLPSPDDPFWYIKQLRIWIGNNLRVLSFVALFAVALVLGRWYWQQVDFADRQSKFVTGLDYLEKGLAEQAQQSFAQSIDGFESKAPFVWKLKHLRSQIGYRPSIVLLQELQALENEVDASQPDYPELKMLMADLRSCTYDVTDDEDWKQALKDASKADLTDADQHYAQAILSNSTLDCRKHLDAVLAIQPNHDRGSALSAALFLAQGAVSEAQALSEQQLQIKPNQLNLVVVQHTAALLRLEERAKDAMYVWLRANTRREFYTTILRLNFTPSIFTFSSDAFWQEVISVQNQIPRTREAESLIRNLPVADDKMALPIHVLGFRADKWASFRGLLEEAIETDLSGEKLTALDQIAAEDSDGFFLLASSMRLAMQMCSAWNDREFEVEDCEQAYQRFLKVQEEASTKQSLFPIEEAMFFNQWLTRISEFDMIFRMGLNDPEVEQNLRSSLNELVESGACVERHQRDRLIKMLLEGVKSLYNDETDSGVKNRIARLALIVADDWALASPSEESSYYQAGFLHYSGEDSEALEILDQILARNPTYQNAIQLKKKLTAMPKAP
ncbi:MAG: protein kinase [Planctomycetota bacterium]